MTYLENRGEDEFITVAELREMFRILKDEVNLQNEKNALICGGLEEICLFFLKIQNKLDKNQSPYGGQTSSKD